MSGELLNSVTQEFRDTDEVIYPGISETTAANNPLQNGSTTRARQFIPNKVVNLHPWVIKIQFLDVYLFIYLLLSP